MLRSSVVALLVLVACKDREAKPAVAPAIATKPAVGVAVAPGTMRWSPVETAYGVAVPSGDVAALVRLARDKRPNVDVETSTVRERFDAEQLAYLETDVAPNDFAALMKSTAYLVVSGKSDRPVELARELASAARDVAAAAHGWVFDPEVQQLYTAVEFEQHVPGVKVDARELIVVHAVTGDTPFVATVGMARYGLPDLFVPNVSPMHGIPLTHLLNGAAQVLIAGGDVDAHGQIAIDFHRLGWDMNIIGKGTGKAVWKARWGREDGATADDPLGIELVPLQGEGSIGAAKMIDECFGASAEQIFRTEGDDPEIAAAAERARADLVKLRPRFANGIPPGEGLTVKAKFTAADGGVEWMWVSVVAYRGDRFEGMLANVPQLVTSLHDGQAVTVRIADVADYLHAREGAEPAGGYSVEILQRRQAQSR